MIQPTLLDWDLSRWARVLESRIPAADRDPLSMSGPSRDYQRALLLQRRLILRSDILMDNRAYKHDITCRKWHVRVLEQHIRATVEVKLLIAGGLPCKRTAFRIIYLYKRDEPQIPLLWLLFETMIKNIFLVW